MAEIICQMMLRRVGQAEYQSVEFQHRTRMPAPGDLVEVTVDKKQVLGRVAHVKYHSAGIAGTYYVHVDEVSS
jgi:hypothetical protein